MHQYFLDEADQGGLVEWLRQDWERSTGKSVTCQLLLPISAHQDYTEAGTNSRRPHCQFEPVYMGKLIGTRCQLKAWWGEDKVGQQEIDGSVRLGKYL